MRKVLLTGYEWDRLSPAEDKIRQDERDLWDDIIHLLLRRRPAEKCSLLEQTYARSQAYHMILRRRQRGQAETDVLGVLVAVQRVELRPIMVPCQGG